jgi:surfeit locus 1 family protein
VPLGYGSRRNLVAAWLLAALGVLCLLLARWQWQRAGESRAAAAQFGAGAAHAVLTDPPLDSEGMRYQRLKVRGAYVPARQFLLDNMVEGGQAGYEVLTPFRMSDSGRWLLVNRGWVPAAPDRRVLPDVRIDDGEREVVGRIDRLPRAGLKLGGDSGEANKADAVAVLSYPTAEELSERLGRAVYPYQLLLAATEPGGFTRNWRPAGLGPERHLAYAGQWLLFACGAVAGAVAIVWRGLRSRSA